MNRNSSHRQGREKKKPAVEDSKGRMGVRQDPAEWKFESVPLCPLVPRPCPFQHSWNIVCPQCEGYED